MRKIHRALLVPAATLLLPLTFGCAQDRQGEQEAWQAEMHSAFQSLRDRRYPESIATYRKALALAEKIAKNGVPAARTHNDIATVYMAQDQFDSASAEYQAAIAIIDSRNEKQNPETNAMLALCDALEGLGTVMHRKGDLAASEKYYARAAKLISGCQRPSKERQIVSEYRSVLQAEGKLDEIERLNESYKGLADAEAMPNAQDHIKDETSKHLHTAEEALKAKDSDKAEQSLREALTYAMNSKDGKFRAMTEARVAMFLFGTQKVAESHSFLREALREMKAAKCSDIEMLPYLLTLSTVQMRLGKYDLAEKTGRLALKVAEANCDPNGREIAASLSAVVSPLVLEGRYEEAMPMWERSYKITKKLDPPASPAAIMNACWLANFYWLAGKKQNTHSCLDDLITSFRNRQPNEVTLAGRLLTDYGQECLHHSAVQPKEEGALFFQYALKVMKKTPRAAQEIQRAEAELKALQTPSAT